jgi:hypothetical protein
MEAREEGLLLQAQERWLRSKAKQGGAADDERISSLQCHLQIQRPLCDLS